MKLGNYVPVTGMIENVKVFTPCSHLILALKYPSTVGVSSFLQNPTKIQVELQNSATGVRNPIIPFIRLNTLAEIATYNEGACILEDKIILFPVMLNPSGNIKLDSDKFIELSLANCDAQSVEVYAFETGVFSEFVTKYSKMSIPSGTARQKFVVTSSDLVVFPTTGFESINLTYKNGVVSNITPTEFKYLMSKNNDITAYKVSSIGGVEGGLPDVFVSGGAINISMIMGYSSNFILNLLDVESIEVIRDNINNATYEFVLGDLVK